MGQYYEVINLTKKTKIEHNFDSIGGMKLMEHSYIGNPLSILLRKKLSKEWKGNRIIHCGDYALDSGGSAEDVANTYEEIIHNALEGKIKTIQCPKKSEDFVEDLDLYPFIANMDKKVYFDIRDSIPNSIRLFTNPGYTKLCISLLCPDPLLLLTACGNGLGGGDYGDEFQDAKKIGSWAGDRIFTTNNLEELKDYEKEIYYFTERKTKLNSETDVKTYLDKMIKEESLAVCNWEPWKYIETTKKKISMPKEIEYYGTPKYKEYLLDLFKKYFCEKPLTKKQIIDNLEKLNLKVINEEDDKIEICLFDLSHKVVSTYKELPTKLEKYLSEIDVDDYVKKLILKDKDDGKSLNQLIKEVEEQREKLSELIEKLKAN